MSTPDQSMGAGGAPARRRIAIGGFRRIELLPRAPYEAAYTPDQAAIGFAFEAQSGEHAFASSRRAGFRAQANGLAFVPAGCDVYSRSGRGGEYLRITLDRAPLPPRRFNDVVDPPAIRAADGLRRQILGGAPDTLVCEALALALAGRVAAVLAGGAPRRREARWMTPRRLRLVEEMVEARLDERLSVRALADALGLSAGFFSRAFKAATGKAPHDYIIDRRLARARELLKEPAADLTSVALSAGFASHAHMSALFRERLGAPPSALRGRAA